MTNGTILILHSFVNKMPLQILFVFVLLPVCKTLDSLWLGMSRFFVLSEVKTEIVSVLFCSGSLPVLRLCHSCNAVFFPSNIAMDVPWFMCSYNKIPDSDLVIRVSCYL